LPNAALTFAGAFVTSGAFSTTLTATADTTVTLPTTGTLSTLAGAEALTNKTITVSDDILLRLGTDGDQAFVNRSTILGLNTALTNVLVGTPASAATPANSLLISNITADGDIAFFTRNASGADSIEALRFDASAGLIVFNEAAADFDFRVEGDNNANMFVMDAGTDSNAFGSAIVSGSFLSINGSAVNRAGVTGVGRNLHLPAATFTQTNGAITTLAIGAGAFYGTPTFAGSNVTQVLTAAANVYIEGPATASTNMAITNAYALWVDAGNVRFDGKLLGGSATPSIAGFVAVDGGGGATAGVETLGTGSTDIAGTLTTTADAHQSIVVTFSSAYPNAPFCVTTPANSAASVVDASATSTYVVTSTTTMTVNFRSSDSTLATWAYHCIGY